MTCLTANDRHCTRATSGSGARALLVAAAALTLTACGDSSQAQPVPSPDGNVTDNAEVLTDDQERALEELIDRENAATDAARVAVLTETDVAGDIEDRARTVATDWGVGDAEVNNGVLVLLSVEDREVRVEVADGARERLSDDAASAIVEDTMVPNFADEHYAIGLTDGTQAIYDAAEGRTDPTVQEDDGSWVWMAGIIGLVVAVVAGLVGWAFISSQRRSKRARTLLEEARREDPDLDLSEEQETAYKKWAQTKPVNNILPIAVWLPLYQANPQAYGAPSVSAGGGTGGSSFGGGSGFTGGGATGSW